MEMDHYAAKVWSMARITTPMAVRTAATLRIADHIAAGRHTVADMAPAIPADPDALERLLRYLAERGLLDRDETARYTLTPLGAALRDDHPAKVRARIDVDGLLGRAELSWVQLPHCVRTGRAGFPEQFGRSLWEDVQAEPDRAHDFNTLTSNMEVQALDIVAGYDWEALGNVVDVGGGNGALLVTMLTKYPAMRGTVLEIPDNCENARRNVERAGLVDRLDVLAGDFFEPLPAGAGGYVLAFVLHNWADDPAIDILRRAAQAAGSTGVVLVVERNGADGQTPHFAMDLRMLAWAAGKERTVPELVGLAGRAGLQPVGVHAAGMASILELAAA